MRNAKLTVGSLFAGIGGFDLGLERAGMTVKWQVEIDPFCRKVLEKHWPDVRRYEDVRTVGSREWADRQMDGMVSGGCCDGDYPGVTYHGLERVDVIAGGFPCQDISVAGRGAGLAGERSGLWSEYARLIRQLRPRYVLVENVTALLGRGMERVLGDLAACGYDAEWDCLPASAFGAPHIRDRVWIVAYANGPWELQPEGQQPDERRRTRDGRQAVADANGSRSQERFVFRRVSGEARCHDDGEDVAVGRRWPAEPDVGRVAHGVPARVDRLRGLGNAIVPQIAEWIGRRIIEADVEMSIDHLRSHESR